MASSPWPLFGLCFGLLLAGCAGTNDMAGAFVDPSRFNLYNCSQLAPERTAAIAKQQELEGLMAKAQEGTAGPLMAELGYRTEYLSARGRREALDKAWVDKNCASQPITPVPARPKKR